MTDLVPLPAPSPPPAHGGWMHRLESGLAALRKAWPRSEAPRPQADARRPLDPALPPADAERVRAMLRACLDETGGEVAVRDRAIWLGQSYLQLDDGGRLAFLHILATEFDVDPAAVDAATAAWARAADAVERREALAALRRSTASPRRELLQNLNALRSGVALLVQMRAEVLSLVREHYALRPLDEDLAALLRDWFDIGNLDMRRLTWAETPPALLDKLIAYEAVHRIDGYDDLRNRLDAADRRVYAFFHPRMTAEPLIFVQVALVDGLADDVQRLLDPAAPQGDAARADTAIFYSISNCQAGLRGIGFGNFLIKHVVREVQRELPNVTRFATLSPVPGFRPWLDRWLEDGAVQLPAEDRAALERAGSELAPDLATLDDSALLRRLLAQDGWWQSLAAAAALEAPLRRLAALYLLQEKRSDGLAGNPVAHFHLDNGAELGRIHHLADRSGAGLRGSYGIMVNYVYPLDRVDANHEAYRTAGTIARDKRVEALLPAPPARRSARRSAGD